MPQFVIEIPACGGCCGCHSLWGDLLDIVVSGWALCPGYATPASAFTGINGATSGIAWNGSIWTGIIGTITVDGITYDVAIGISCDFVPGLGSFASLTIHTVGGGFPLLFLVLGIPLDTPSANIRACDFSLGAGGTITLSLP